jgi:ferredoxin
MAVRHRIVLDSDACTGHGRCYAESPALFEPDEQGFGVVSQEVVGDDQLPLARRAENACPERAIKVTGVEEN